MARYLVDVRTGKSLLVTPANIDIVRRAYENDKSSYRLESDNAPEPEAPLTFQLGGNDTPLNDYGDPTTAGSVINTMFPSTAAAAQAGTQPTYKEGFKDVFSWPGRLAATVVGSPLMAAQGAYDAPWGSKLSGASEGFTEGVKAGTAPAPTESQDASVYGKLERTVKDPVTGAIMMAAPFAGAAAGIGDGVAEGSNLLARLFAPAASAALPITGAQEGANALTGQDVTASGIGKDLLLNTGLGVAGSSIGAAGKSYALASIKKMYGVDDASANSILAILKPTPVGTLQAAKGLQGDAESKLSNTFGNITDVLQDVQANQGPEAFDALRWQPEQKYPIGEVQDGRVAPQTIIPFNVKSDIGTYIPDQGMQNLFFRKGSGTIPLGAQPSMVVAPNIQFTGPAKWIPQPMPKAEEPAPVSAEPQVPELPMFPVHVEPASSVFNPSWRPALADYASNVEDSRNMGDLSLVDYNKKMKDVKEVATDLEDLYKGGNPPVQVLTNRIKGLQETHPDIASALIDGLGEQLQGGAERYADVATRANINPADVTATQDKIKNILGTYQQDVETAQSVINPPSKLPGAPSFNLHTPFSSTLRAAKSSMPYLASGLDRNIQGVLPYANPVAQSPLFGPRDSD